MPAGVLSEARRLVGVMMDLDRDNETRAGAIQRVMDLGGPASFAGYWLMFTAGWSYELESLALTYGLDTTPTWTRNDEESRNADKADGLHLLATARGLGTDLRHLAACTLVDLTGATGYVRVRHQLSHSGWDWLLEHIQNEPCAYYAAQFVIADPGIAMAKRVELAQHVILGLRPQDALTTAVEDLLRAPKTPSQHRLALALELTEIDADSERQLNRGHDYLEQLAASEKVAGLHRVQAAEALLAHAPTRATDALASIMNSAHVDPAARELARRSLRAAHQLPGE
jgi:hypothetical protein